MNERDRLSKVLNELIELQWTAKGMANESTSKKELYESMIEDVILLIKTSK